MRFLYLLLFLSPLPFASARPVWQYMWVIFIGLSGIIYTLRWKALNTANLPKAFYFPVSATLFLVFWGGLQVINGWTPSPHETIGTSLFFFTYLVWFFLVFKSFKRRHDVPKLVLMLGLIITVYCIYGLIVYFTGNETILWYKKWTNHESLTSTFVNRNSFSTYVGVGFQCMMAYALWTYTHKNTIHLPFKEQFIQFLSKDLTKTVIIVLSLITLLSSLFLTASRAGIITSLIGAALLILFSTLGTSSHHTEGPNPTKKYLLLAGLAAIALLTFSMSGDLFSKRIEAVGDNDMRFLAYPLMIDALESTPVKGTGIGAFAEVFAQYRIDAMILPFNKGHNDVLEILMTAGLIAGTLFVLSFIFITIWIFLKALKNSEYKIFLLLGASVSVQIGLHSLVDFSLQMPAISYLYITLLSAVAFLISRSRYQTKSY
ncbi:O-antigen ligase family protein [Kordiimonas pumila]|uniref:O-antigen ligase family protein n=1 Tax=Kordiimonas pumila TaxID=2161677 RepID=A0ABV7D327_9PROT|nr:O-antigen ligase family protein [Kordiimonas pumila]